MRDHDVNRSGHLGHWSAPGRGEVGPKSGGGRIDKENDAPNDVDELLAADAKTQKNELKDARASDVVVAVRNMEHGSSGERVADHDVNRSGHLGHWSAPGRGEVGPKSGGGRSIKNYDPTNDVDELLVANAKTQKNALKGACANAAVVAVRNMLGSAS